MPEISVPPRNKGTAVSAKKGAVEASPRAGTGTARGAKRSVSITIPEVGKTIETTPGLPKVHYYGGSYIINVEDVDFPAGRTAHLIVPTTKPEGTIQALDWLSAGHLHAHHTHPAASPRWKGWANVRTATGTFAPINVAESVEALRNEMSDLRSEISGLTTVVKRLCEHLEGSSLNSSIDGLAWAALAESAFAFWENEEDAAYDAL